MVALVVAAVGAVGCIEEYRPTPIPAITTIITIRTAAVVLVTALLIMQMNLIYIYLTLCSMGTPGKTAFYLTK